MVSNFAVVFILFWALIGFMLFVSEKNKNEELKKTHDFEIQRIRDVHEREIKTERQDAVNRSRAVLKGKISEHLAPFLPGFKYNAADARFFGSPIDFIIFDGMSDGDVEAVIIMDIKTGKSRLNKNQSQIRRAIREGRVRFETLRIE